MRAQNKWRACGAWRAVISLKYAVRLLGEAAVISISFVNISQDRTKRFQAEKNMCRGAVRLCAEFNETPLCLSVSLSLSSLGYKVSPYPMKQGEELDGLQFGSISQKLCSVRNY
jgi:hypothetical protein